MLTAGLPMDSLEPPPGRPFPHGLLGVRMDKDPELVSDFHRFSPFFLAKKSELVSGLADFWAKQKSKIVQRIWKFPKKNKSKI